MRTTVIVLSLLASVAGTAAAQTPAQGRVTVGINGGYQSASQTFSDTRTDPFFAETASWTGDYRVKSAPVFGGDANIRLWRNIGLMVGFSRFEDTQAASFSGTVPHPFFFNRNRDISGEESGLKRSEQTIHAGVSLLIPAGRRMQVMLSAGPSFVSVDQDLAEDVEYGDVYPYDTATYEGIIRRSVSGSTTGFNVGADLGYFFNRTVGLGASLRMTSASVDLASPARDGDISVDAGGMQAGIGLRFRFGR